MFVYLYNPFFDFNSLYIVYFLVRKSELFSRQSYSAILLYLHIILSVHVILNYLEKINGETYTELPCIMICTILAC